MIKILVTGGRKYREEAHVYATLDKAHAYYGALLIIEGGAGGVDTFASEWARKRGVHTACVRAIWEKYPKSAGPIRNGVMLWLKPDLCMAFSGGSGTANMKTQAKAAGVPVYEV